MGILSLSLSNKQLNALRRGATITVNKHMEDPSGVSVEVDDKLARKFTRLQGSKGLRIRGSVESTGAGGFGGFAKGLAKGLVKQVVKKGIDTGLDAAIGGGLLSDIGRSVGKQVAHHAVEKMVGGNVHPFPLNTSAYVQPHVFEPRSTKIRNMVTGEQQSGGRIDPRVGRAFRSMGRSIVRFGKSKAVKSAVRTVGKTVAHELKNAARDPNMQQIMREEGRDVFDNAVSSTVGKIQNKGLNRLAGTYTSNLGNSIYTRPEPVQAEAAYADDNVGGQEGSGVRRFVKGSQSARDHMARLRAMKKGARGGGFRGIY